jgi:2-methylcitrate dehydratase PrpD
MTQFEGVTKRLVEFSLRTQFKDLPKEVIDKAKLMFLDAVGCALGGYVTDRAKLAIELVEETGGHPQATIFGHRPTSCDRAAFANGELITALDYDCLGPLKGQHVTPYVTPPCVAMAERTRASGKELLTALVVAHEIGGRFLASLAAHRVPKEEPPYYEYYPRFSHAYTLFGAVAGACKLLGLDAAKTLNAFGIAGASAPVPGGVKWEFIDGPAIMMKFNAWAGWVSQLATVATLLAQKGFTGDTTILDGDLGFWKMVGSPWFKLDLLFGGLGEIWHKDVEFKWFPVCGLNRAGIEGIQTLLKEQGIKPEEIETLVVKSDPFIQTPNRMMSEVKSFADMQYSNVNIFAVAAYYGDRPSPAWQTPVIYNDPKVRALAKKVRIESYPGAETLIADALKMEKPLALNTIVEIEARGRTYTVEVSTPKGRPANPLVESEILEKFKMNVSFSKLPGQRVPEIVKTILGLEGLDDVTQLTRLLTVNEN